MSNQQINKEDWRNQELKYDQFHFRIVLEIIAITILMLAGFVIFSKGDGYSTNLYTSIWSIIVTVGFLDLLAKRREKNRDEKLLKENRIRELGSNINDVSRHAAEKLRGRGWLQDGSLKNQDFFRANLRDVILINADLRGSDFVGAKLNGAFLLYANLEGAILFLSDTTKYESFTSAARTMELLEILGIEYFENIGLDENLKKDIRTTFQNRKQLTDFLNRVDLRDAEFDLQTILPDGSLWTPETNMKRFTDPSHPNFWKNDVQSLST